jgi:protein tyrosine phosphatase (PTP) superfamily phosphohydrolase (DUF442 family)
MREEGVSVAYPTAMSKDGEQGRLRPVGFQGLRYVQFPFLLWRRSFWALILALNWWDIIDEQVLLGGALMFDDLERLRQLGVGAVINLCAERPDNPYRLKSAQMEYLWLPVADTHAPTVDQIVRGLAWLEQRVQTGRKVYIHCASGMGRSVTLLACWYLYTESMSVSQVLAFVKRRRPQMSLTRRQVRRIQEIASLLIRTAGKLPVQASHARNEGIEPNAYQHE